MERKNGLKALLGMFVILVIAGLSTVTVSAQENVSATFDGDINLDNQTINGTLSSGQTYQETFYLPMALGQVNATNTNILVTAGSTGPTDIDLDVNGNDVATATLAADATEIYNKTTWVNAGVSNSSTYINVSLSVTANNTAQTNLSVIADDGTLSGDNFSYSISESVIEDPVIGYDDSTYTVEDKVKVEQDSDFNLTAVNATFTYPGITTSKDITSYSYGQLNTSESGSKTLAYQKDGPYVSDIDTSKDGNERSTELRVYSYENLSAVVFDENLLEDPWKDYFPNLNKDTLTIELDGSDVDFEDPEGQVTTEEMSLGAGYHTLTFNYTTVTFAPAMITVQEKPWHQFMGIDYFWPIVIGITLLVIGFAVLATKRE